MRQVIGGTLFIITGALVGAGSAMTLTEYLGTEPALQQLGEGAQGRERIAQLMHQQPQLLLLTLEPGVEVLYKVSAPYAPGCERAIMWNDKDIAIDWPLPPGESPLLSAKDAVAMSLAAFAASARALARSAALACAAEGANVVCAARTLAAVEATAAEGAKAGGTLVAQGVDVSDMASTEALAAATLKRFGRIDALINDKRQLADAVVGTPAALIFLSRAEFEQRIEAMDPIMRQISRILVRRVLRGAALPEPAAAERT